MNLLHIQRPRKKPRHCTVKKGSRLEDTCCGTQGGIAVLSREEIFDIDRTIS